MVPSMIESSTIEITILSTVLYPDISSFVTFVVSFTISGISVVEVAIRKLSCVPEKIKKNKNYFY